jgi:hypothetical protein
MSLQTTDQGMSRTSGDEERREWEQNHEKGVQQQLPKHVQVGGNDVRQRHDWGGASLAVSSASRW